MTLVECPDCDGDVSKNAPTCPHCGAKLKRTNTDSCLGCVLLILVFFVVVAIAGPIGDSIF